MIIRCKSLRRLFKNAFRTRKEERGRKRGVTSTSVSKNGKDEGNGEREEFERKARGITPNKRCIIFRVKTIKVWIRSNDERNSRDYKNETTFSDISSIKMKRQGFRIGNK